MKSLSFFAFINLNIPDKFRTGISWLAWRSLPERSRERNLGKHGCGLTGWDKAFAILVVTLLVAV
jgi:hypothetical protein